MIRVSCLLAALALATPAGAQTLAPECAPLVGTFLTLKSDDPTADPGEVGRSLVSLTGDGLAFMTDTAQGGGDAFQPFTDASGAWACEGTDEAGAVGFRASMIDFTLPTDEMPEQQVVRVDIAGRFAPIAGEFTGETRVSFFPIDGDPFDLPAATSSTGYSFTGRKVTVGE